MALEDGSRVTLDPGSNWVILHIFVTAGGRYSFRAKAFFDIAKDPSKPFFVYANELVTKVLGTSFTVSYANEQNVSVAVKTGKVAVFSREDTDAIEKQNSRELTGVVIEPNQQVVFARKTVKITKGIVPEPEVVAEAGTAPNFRVRRSACIGGVFSTSECLRH